MTRPSLEERVAASLNRKSRMAKALQRVGPTTRMTRLCVLWGDAANDYIIDRELKAMVRGLRDEHT